MSPAPNPPARCATNSGSHGPAGAATQNDFLRVPYGEAPHPTSILHADRWSWIVSIEEAGMQDALWLVAGFGLFMIGGAAIALLGKA